MRPAVPILLGLLLVGTVTAACSTGPSVDAACDVDGVTEEVEHMVGEASMTLESIQTLQCSGEWAVAQVTVRGAVSEPEPAMFVFQGSDACWILKAPELVCGGGADAATIPADLAEVACPTG